MSSFSDSIQDKIITVKDRFYSALDDFSSSYINYKLYPDYKDYRRTHLNSQRIIDALQADLFVATNDIQSNINRLQELINNLNSKISAEKTKNASLITKYNGVTNNSNGSKLLIDESKNLYFNKYVSNVSMIVGIIMVLITMFKVYSKPPQMPITV